MTLPTEVAFAVIKYGDGADPEVFAAVCGITNVSINETADTTQRRVRDCATPNKPGTSKSKLNGTSWTISGSGLTNVDQRAVMKSTLFSKFVNYEIELYADDGSDAGALLGTEAGQAVLTTNNMSMDQDGESSLELNLEGQGALVYTAA
jgi:predicted secreted protein